MNVDLPATILDLCAGFGMLAEGIIAGLERFGLAGRVVCHVERDSAAAASLVARMEISPVDQAPVWDCLDTFDGRPWRGLVDILCAGLPCQPYSLAGKKLGNIDKRSHGEDGDGPIPHFLRIVDGCRPAVVFLENVPAWVVGGHFRSVGEELCRMGYTLEDPFFVAAGDVGAPHERERVFILAYLAGERFAGDAQRNGHQVKPEQCASCGGDAYRFLEELGNAGRATRQRNARSILRAETQSSRGGVADGYQPVGCANAGKQLAIASGARREEAECGGAFLNEGSAARGSASEFDSELGDSAGTRRDGEGRGQPAEPQRRPILSCPRCAGLPLFPPGRGDYGAWAAVAAVDASRMPRVEPEFSMVADGMAFSRADLLRIGGNGVVTLAAAVAFVTLWNQTFNRNL